MTSPTALMQLLAQIATHSGVGRHTYVVGGAVRNHLIGVPVKDVDVVVDSVALKGRNSEWFARKVAQTIPTSTKIVTNQYGVAILTVVGSFHHKGVDLVGSVVEIANAREESYGGGKGKGYKPTDVRPASIQADILRRDFTVNTLLWRLSDLVEGPASAEIIDITGVGLTHIQERVLRTPLDADRTFTDDPTRLLRLVKFALKYGFDVPNDLCTAVVSNAGKLKDMPWEAVANILVRDILDTSKAREALVLMKSLGLIDVLADMIRTEKPFAAFMAGQMTVDKDAQLLLDLAGLGLGDKAVSFLTPAQQSHLREITVSMERQEASAFLLALKSPPIDNMAIIEEFNLQPKDRGILAPTARRLLLEQPSLALSPATLTEEVRRLIALR